MRLINIKLEDRMFFEEFNEPEIPSYVILSHTWEKEEISYAEASVIFSSYSVSSVNSKAGFKKIERFAAVARESGFHYIWVDTCCIDKSSSAELSEAINSMYRWYRNSTLCCIYLADVPEQPNNWHMPAVKSKFSQALKQTRWLTRGWTLQELLAQRNRKFYTMGWQLIPLTPHVLNLITEETGIPMDAIIDFKPERWSVAQKMSWAAHRRTTRVEDRAYSLLGVFNVNMPLIYGEGDTAFRRLQEEIFKNSTDQTIFCWTAPEASFSSWRGMLARSPSEFANSGGILENKRLRTQPFQLTNKGIQMSLKLAPISSAPGDFVALLQCYHANSQSQCGIYIRRIHDDNYIRVVPNVVAEIRSSFVHNVVTLFETLFVKPELAGILWYKSNMCPRIAGFRFPHLPYEFNLSAHPNVWINDIIPKDQFSLDQRMFSFCIDQDEKAPTLATARCHLESVSDCSIEILVKYDWRKNYGEDDEDFERDRETRSTTNLDWVQSECCEWKIQGMSCDQFEMRLSSWIEFDDKSDAYIFVEFFDSGDHDICDCEEWEPPADVIQGENGDSQAVSFISVFPVQMYQH